jgi:hypothetical protein
VEAATPEGIHGSASKALGKGVARAVNQVSQVELEAVASFAYT